MKQLLESYGWWQYHSCTCGGSLKQKFKHKDKPTTEIHIRPNKNKWFLMISNKVAAQGNHAQLIEKIKTI